MILRFISIVICAVISSQVYAQQNTFSNNGSKVGIHTLQPGAFLDVSADLTNGKLGTVMGRLPEGNSSGEGTFLGVRGYDTRFNSVSGPKSFSIEHSFYGFVNSSINFFRGSDTKGGFMTFNTFDNIERMRLDKDGNLLLGTTTARGEKLSINGGIRAHEIKVETSNWPDYVFKAAYKLPSLTETEQFIKQHGHLPEVPKASEVEADGVSLGEMNKILLKKIEELTLQVIELNKKVDRQEERINLK
ncbi:hypothetical protein [Sphingobacterium siyangense]|uniref:hypothetical protein n=1 Tax=Sphingobacterium siyangense TaxID=459529 RepID=UPI002FDEA6FA